MKPTRRSFLKLIGMGLSAPTCLLDLKFDRPRESIKQIEETSQDPTENVVLVSPSDIYETKEKNPLIGLPLRSMRFDFESQSFDRYLVGGPSIRQSLQPSVTGHFTYLNTKEVSDAQVMSMLGAISPWKICAGDKIYTFKGMVINLNRSVAVDMYSEIGAVVSVIGEVAVEMKES